MNIGIEGDTELPTPTMADERRPWPSSPADRAAARARKPPQVEPVRTSSGYRAVFMDGDPMPTQITYKATDGREKVFTPVGERVRQ